MAILNIPLWPFEPNWTSSLTEVLEWLTDVIISPSGSEQRRSIRYFPRKTFEFSVLVASQERSFLDNMLATHSAKTWYLPLWHDTNLLDAQLVAGTRNVACATAASSKLTAGSVAVLVGETAFETELVEIEAMISGGVRVVSPVLNSWPAGTRLFPVSRARLTEQPEVRKRTDTLAETEVRFLVVEPNAGIVSNDTGLSDQYQGFDVLTIPPDDRSPLNSGIERMLVELDNLSSVPVWADTADRPFFFEQFSWILEGRAELRQFENLLQKLRGRAQALWVPSFMQDFTLALPVANGSNLMTVKRSGFTDAGGPRPERQDIMIETLTSRVYRRVTNSALTSGGNEILTLNTGISGGVNPSQIVRISFINLMRMNQDSVTVEHQTDTFGVSAARTVFRSAPNTRNPLAANL